MNDSQQAPFNPYQPPGAAPPPFPGAPRKRTPIPMVYGILCLVFAAFAVFGLISIIINMGMARQNLPLPIQPPPMWYLILTAIMTVINMCLLLGAGLMLLKYRDTGRLMFNVYAVLAMISSVLGLGVTISMVSGIETGGDPAMKAGLIGGLVGGVFGALIGLAFPLSGLVLLNRTKTKDALSE